MAEEAAPPKRQRSMLKRFFKELFWLLLILGGIIVLALVAVDTQPGKRLIADKIEATDLGGGIYIKIGRIEGSITDRAVLRNVEVRDKDGVFLTSPAITLDWAPLAYLYGKVHIDELSAETVRLDRLPATVPSGDPDKPILPGFDLEIRKLNIAELVVGEAIGGTERRGRVQGKADIRAGRALVDLKAEIDGADRIAIRIDSEPDRNQLDLGARVVAPEGGLVAGLLGLTEDAELTLVGKGDWAAWAGEAKARVGDVEALDLDVTASDGEYGLSGTVRADALLTGIPRQLLGGGGRIDASGRFDERRLTGELRWNGARLSAAARGGVDLGTNRYDDLSIGAELKQPSAILPTLGGQPVRLTATLDGAMNNFAYSYRLRGAATQLDEYRLEGWQADGRGQYGPSPNRVPLTFTAQRVVGGGDIVTDLFTDVRLEALLFVTPDNIRADDARLQTRRLRALLDLSLDLESGAFDLAIDGRLPGYELPGIGRMDIITDLDVQRAGNGTRISGPVRVNVTRLDNSFFAGLTGGNPQLSANIVMGPDGVMRFTNLIVKSPDLNLTGQGLRRRDGTFLIEASGTQASYGPVEVRLDGDIQRPEVSLKLASPNEPLGLSNVLLDLSPTEEGFDFTATGGSRFGPFGADGLILLPEGGNAVIDFASLRIAGSEGAGRLTILPGGFDGQLRLAGGEISGTIDLAPHAQGQQIGLDLALANASFPGPPEMSFVRGDVDAVMILSDDGIMIDGKLDARRADISGLDFGRIVAEGRLTNGRGMVEARMTGPAGSTFAFDLNAAIAPERIALSGKGSLDRRPLTLENAVLTPVPGGWRLSRARLGYHDGGATVSGLLTDTPQINATLEKLPLELFDLVDPELGLAGDASGTVSFTLGRQRSGEVDLKIKGLSRAGLVLASRPIDVALKGKLDARQLGMRAVLGAGGEELGRMQARFSPIGNGNFFTELVQAPMVAQLRYDGPADTLWRLSGFELFDLSGPMAAAVDIRGRLALPRVQGAVQLKGARLESPVTGMVLRDVTAHGRFVGPRLNIETMRGTTRGGGSVSGSGTVMPSATGVILNLDFNADRAQILNRDDIAATVTGPIRIRSEGNGGVIGGELRLNEGKFTLGQAGSVAAVPQIDVIERGLPPEQVIEREQLAPWRLDMKVTGGPLEVRGLGIESFWRTNLDISGVITDPRLNGSATLQRGEYNFAGRSFELTEGDIRFRGQSPVDPTLNIVAETQLSDISATVNVAGTGLNPQITFASVPALPEDELLARLLFGTSITNLSVAEAAQLGVAVASLRGGGGGLDPINSIREAVGLDRLRIMPADIATGQKVSVAAGKYITRKLFVEVISDGQGYTATQVEYQITRWLSILAAIDSINRSGVNVRVSKDY
ncbi:translocation/assembly module TamB domain-containing protein [Sphingomicrobium flavum]|uniref:translocation/assembly module TamB domain-containing protein n=1 Tax=Sphingomicrobium flavum TaxID=1229164 RepID=UPI0021ADEE05|nr:translocation/assembly module TamB domain-containing protein [Sphingomicrobium flavum]